LVMPAAAAQQLTARPVLGLCLSGAIGLVVVWTALGVAFYSTWPVGFFVSSFGFAAYLAAAVFRLAASHPAGTVRTGGRSQIPGVATA